MSDSLATPPKAPLFVTVLTDLPNLGEEEYSIENVTSLTHAVVGALHGRDYTSAERTKIVKALVAWSGRGPGDRRVNEEFGRSLYDIWSQKNDVTLGWPYIRGLVEAAKLQHLIGALDDPNERPLIKVIAGREAQAVTMGEAALIVSGLPIYQRGKVLVKPGTHEVGARDGHKTFATSFYEMGAYAIKDHMGRAAHWTKFDARSNKFKEIDPPKDLAEVLLSRKAEWKFANIVGIITAPTLRPDGSVLSAPGFDKRTRLWNASHEVEVLPMVDKPSMDDAKAALVLLQDLLTEFPFVTEVDRAVALSAMITSVVRSCMENVPMHAFRASTAGSGKSYLCDIVSALCIGRFCPAASTGTDMKEFESCLNGMLLAGHSIFSLDNINGDLGGDLLCRALTQRSLLLRMLGSSKMHETETQTTILANGNAITVVGDAIRRVLMANLDPKMERPELREFDKRPYDMVIGDRSKYVSACLTIVRAYILAERPKCLSPKLASFEGWSDNVRSALVWLGCADPVASMDQAREDDPVLGQLREFIALWPASLGDTCGHTVADLIKAAEGRAKEEEGGVMLNPDWRACLMRIAGKPGGIDATALGKWLGSKAGRVVGEVRIAKSGSNASGGVRRWLLETIPPLAA